jgi:NADPH:quinone reductase
MKAAVIRELGDASVVKFETEYPIPELKQGEVMVKNEIAGLNFIDTYFRSGLYQKPTPFIAGQEGGGVVFKSTVEEFKEGDRVVYNAFGSYAEYTAAPAEKLVKIPDTIPMETAVACMIQGLTAHYLVTDATAGLIRKGEWCLIYSVGSGTCQWAAQMARIQGYKVIGTTSKTKADVAAAWCDELIVLEAAAGKTFADYQSVDIVSKVMELTQGHGCKCVIDGVGKSTSEISLQCLAQRGIFITFGNASGPVPEFPVLRLVAKSAFLTRPKLGDYIASREELDHRAKEVFEWIEAGKLSIAVDKIFELEQCAEGHRYLESGQSKGKVLYKI